MKLTRTAWALPLSILTTLAVTGAWSALRAPRHETTRMTAVVEQSAPRKSPPPAAAELPAPAVKTSGTRRLEQHKPSPESGNPPPKKSAPKTTRIASPKSVHPAANTVKKSVEKPLTGKEIQDLFSILDEASALLNGRQEHTHGPQEPPIESPIPSARIFSEDSLKDKIRLHSARIGVPAELALAIAHVESRFTPDAVSHRGAIGLMQVMPETGALYGASPEDLFDPDTSILVGLKYFQDMLLQFGDERLALAAYNAGPHRVVQANFRIPDIRETRDYVRRVQHEARRYRKQLPE